jgi:hypothetical protein
MPQSFAQYRDTPLWRALERMLADLEASDEVRVDTAPDYVIGFMCGELAARGIVVGAALSHDR